VTAWLGWKTFIEDPDFANATTEIALVHLRWLVAVASLRDPGDVSLIPDSICIQPARWITNVAHRATHLLSPRQAEQAVESATRLLDLGTSSTERRDQHVTFSPIVTTSLIDIISAFVQAGVRRATRKAKIHRHRWDKESDDLTDDRELDIYSSFDANDLGVTVFTNELVRENLCPTLARTFVDVSVVEGFDVEKHDSFSKLGAKSQIAELISRLWFHPSGAFKQSFLAIPDGVLVSFGASVVTAIGVDLNFGLEAVAKVLTSNRQRGRNSGYHAQSTSQAVGMIAGKCFSFGLTSNNALQT
jgi:hypothetical protein